MNRRPFLQLILAAIGIPRAASATARPPTSPPAGGEPDFPAALETWMRQPIQPVLHRLNLSGRTESEVITCVQLWDAIHRRATVTLRYHGGSHPGERRTITPALVFHKIDGSGTPPLYVLAWCHLRREHRTFRLDRMRFEAAT